jgi:hypothetical protein
VDLKESEVPAPGGATGSALTIDTTAGSLLHRLLPPSAWRAYAWGAAVTYLPLFLAARESGLPMATHTSTLLLPFLHDWNVAFMFLVSFPTLLALTVTDHRVIDWALHRIQSDGIVTFSTAADPARISRVWQSRYYVLNVCAHIFGAAVGVVVAALNYRAYLPESVGFWMASGGRLHAVGALFLVCIFLFYALISIYVLRSLGACFLLRDVVSHAQLHLLPFHPDKAGGLRPVGRLGLRNEYVLSVFGINVVLLVVVSLTHLNVRSDLYALMYAAAAAYVILGPLVFVGPLLPFRAGMLRAKSELMGEVAQRLRVELKRLRIKLPSGEITKEDEELIDRLRKIGTVIGELPVWPFDARTLQKFLTAYVTPLLGAAITKPLLTWLASWFH